MATVVVSVNAGSEGGSLATLLEVRKKWELKQFWERKKTTVTFDFADVKIGVDMKFKKGLTGDIEIPFQPYL